MGIKGGAIMNERCLIDDAGCVSNRRDQLQSVGQSPQYRNAGRDRSTFDRAEIASTKSCPLMLAKLPKSRTEIGAFTTH